MLSDPVADLVADPVPGDLARLREEWGEFEVREERHRIPASEYDGTETPDGTFRYASAWIRRDGAVLLVQPTVDEGWTNPGGTHEPGETFAETARREVREEAGIDCEITGVLEAKVTVVEPGDLPPDSSLGVVFHADYVDGEIRPEPGEIDEVGWFSEVPGEEDLVFERIAEYPI